MQKQLNRDLPNESFHEYAEHTASTIIRTLPLYYYYKCNIYAMKRLSQNPA